MANEATVTMEATVLPDEIAKVISGAMRVTPNADGTEKWVYKNTVIGTSHANLISGNFINHTASASDTAVAASDLVLFLFVKNTHASNSIALSLDGSTTNAVTDVDGIQIPAGESVALRIAKTTVENLHAAASSASTTAIVAALLDDA